MRHHLRSAFTLLELSIVIVIIALLVGGVMTGQNMIKAAELRSVMSDAQKYLSAITAFRDQYRYLPGDLPTATSYWNDGTNTTANGDGDGTIGVSSNERFRLWEHLNKAGLIDKKMSGQTGAGGPNDFVITGSATPNIPNSKLANTGFAVFYKNYVAGADTTTGSQRYFIATLNNLLSFGASAGTNNGEPIYAALTPGDAYIVDIKMDDGKPGTGKWIANSTGPSGAAAAYNFTGTSTCTTATAANNYGADLTASYALSNTTIACSFFIMTGY